MKRPVSMPCTEQQWLNEVKPLCDKYGLELESKYYGDILVNDLYYRGIIGFLSKCDKVLLEGNTHYELIPYNPIEFIKACGVEVEQPKWEKLTRDGHEYHIYEEFEGNIFGRVYDYGRWISVDWNNKGERADFVNSPYSLIPYNPRKNELLTKKAELEKQLEEINKELNQ